MPGMTNRRRRLRSLLPATVGHIPCPDGDDHLAVDLDIATLDDVIAGVARQQDQALGSGCVWHCREHATLVGRRNKRRRRAGLKGFRQLAVGDQMAGRTFRTDTGRRGRDRCADRVSPDALGLRVRRSHAGRRRACRARNCRGSAPTFLLSVSASRRRLGGHLCPVACDDLHRNQIFEADKARDERVGRALIKRLRRVQLHDACRRS